MQVGDLRVSQTAVLTNNTLHATCAQFNEDGTPRSSVTLDNSDVGDVAMAHEIIGGLSGLVAMLKPGPAPPVVGAPGRFGMQPGNGLAGAAACIGEHFQGEQAPFPPPPPLQSGQQSGVAPDRPARRLAADPSAADEALQRRLELAARATEPVPWPDRGDTPGLGPPPRQHRRPALGWPGGG